MSDRSLDSRGGKVLALLVLVAFLAVVGVNALANILPLNGVNTGVLSDEIPNLFVPAGLTFSIWGLIYLLLALYVVSILAEAFGKGKLGWTKADGFLFLANAAANIAWIFAWHWRLVSIALALMLVILGTLIALQERNFSRIEKRASAVGPGFIAGLRSHALSLPINVYLGWICVATIANVTAFLVKSGWDGFGIDPLVWTLIAILAGLGVAILLIVKRKAVAAPLVVVWAYAGIVLKRSGADPDATMAVIVAAAASALAILAMLAVAYFAGRRKGA